MAVNLKVAKTLGLAIPSSILLRADEHEFATFWHALTKRAAEKRPIIRRFGTHPGGDPGWAILVDAARNWAVRRPGTLGPCPFVGAGPVWCICSVFFYLADPVLLLMPAAILARSAESIDRTVMNVS